MSVEHQKLRSELMRECLLKGWTRPADVQAPWTTLIEPERLERWFRRLYTPTEIPLVGGTRLVNHFSLGADPEFVFTDGSKRTDARVLNLKAGPAFGADNNGRLVELRPHPSRHALSVLASMWLAMRWMAVFHPNTLAYSWKGGAYYDADGLGGHIHFGRKRSKLRERETAALDRIVHLMYTAGIFDQEEGRMRVRHAQGAPHGHPYGALGDIRKQPHGFEYRTFPSWLDNLWLAYFTLVASKLVVALPEFVPPISQADASLTPEQSRNQLRFLFSYYAPLDDDARLAAAVLSRNGWPRHGAQTDLKNSWGIFGNTPFGNQDVKAPDVYPETIPPRDVDLKELADAMFTGRLPEELPLEPTWTPYKLPGGYYHLISVVDTKISPNLGEVAMRYCFHKSRKIVPTNPGGMGYRFRFPGSAQKRSRETGLNEKYNGTFDCALEEGNMFVNCSKDMPVSDLKAMLDDFVDAHAVPLFRIADVKVGSILEYAKAQEPKAPKASSSKIILKDVN